MSAKFFGRTLARSQALQLLFQAEQTNRTVAEVLQGEYVLSEGPLDPDMILNAYSHGWSVSRMPSVDRNLLQLSLYEMLEVSEVDVSITINEVIELSHAYCGDESPRFINGILGRVAADIAEGMDVYEHSRRVSAGEKSASQEDGE